MWVADEKLIITELGPYLSSCMDKNVMAKITARSSVSLLQSFSVRLGRRSLLGLTTLVAPSLTIVSVAPMHGTVASLWDPEFWLWHHDTRQRTMLAALDLLIQPLWWDKSPRYIIATSTLKNSTKQHVTMYIHRSIPYIQVQRLETPSCMCFTTVIWRKYSRPIRQGISCLCLWVMVTWKLICADPTLSQGKMVWCTYVVKYLNFILYYFFLQCTVFSFCWDLVLKTWIDKHRDLQLLCEDLWVKPHPLFIKGSLTCNEQLSRLIYIVPKIGPLQVEKNVF